MAGSGVYTLVSNMTAHMMRVLAIAFLKVSSVSCSCGPKL